MAGCLTAGVARAAPEPPTPGFAAAIDGFASYDPQDTCDPTAKPGTASFKDFILATYPSTGNSGIVRACNIGGTSEHKEGRAWDWTANVNNAGQKDIADTVIAWLLKTDEHGNACALARRTGMMYFIWNKQIWGAYRSPNGSCATAGWKAYTGTNPHTDHVHLSFSWAGANQQTTWWTSPLPVSCDRSAGGFTFSCDGAQPNMHCVNVDEPSDPDTWSDNYFCSTLPLDMEWSSAGPIADMDCTAVNEASEPLANVWADNYLCVPPQSPFALSYSSAGPIAGKNCVHWNEPGDLANSWSDNFVCTDPVHVFSEGGFSFSMAGAIAGKHCVNVDEPGDPDTWVDNHFCSDADLGMQWSFAGPIAGMECTNVAEAAETLAAAWSDNYLCLPAGSNLRLNWSSAGPLDGQTCVRWFEHAETSPTWIDNWMCVEDLAAPPGGSGGDGGSGGSSGAGWAAEGGQAGGDVGPGTGGSGQATHVLEGEEGGCACRSLGRASTPAQSAWLWVALALSWCRRSRRSA
jgi:hypothetical protein